MDQQWPWPWLKPKPPTACAHLSWMNDFQPKNGQLKLGNQAIDRLHEIELASKKYTASSEVDCMCLRLCTCEIVWLWFSIFVLILMYALFFACGIVFPPHRLFKGIDANVFTQSIFHSFFNYPIFAFVDVSGGFNSIGSATKNIKVWMGWFFFLFVDWLKGLFFLWSGHKTTALDQVVFT